MTGPQIAKIDAQPGAAAPIGGATSALLSPQAKSSKSGRTLALIAWGVSTVQSWVSTAIAAVPGIVALIGAFFWFGQLSARLKAVETDVSELKGIGREVATIAERTKNTDDSMKVMAGDIRAVTRNLLDEGRTFAREVVRQRQASQG
jgi:flagellar basal body-associated protein FliL